MAQWVKNLPAIGRPKFDPWVRKVPWRREWLPTPVETTMESPMRLAWRLPWTEEPGRQRKIVGQTHSII